MAKVSAVSRKGGTAPVAEVDTASVDHRRMARRPMRVALRAEDRSVMSLSAERLARQTPPVAEEGEAGRAGLPLPVR